MGTASRGEGGNGCAEAEAKEGDGAGQEESSGKVKGGEQGGKQEERHPRTLRSLPSLAAHNGPLIRAEALIYAPAQAEIKSNLVGVRLIVGTQRAAPERDLN